MTTETKFSYLEVEAALCVWECINDWTLGVGGATTRNDWEALRKNTGSAELRHWSIELGQWALQVYDICTKHDRDFFDGIAYDWEVIPMILDFVNVDGAQTTSGVELPAPHNVASMVARRHLSDEFIRECKMEASRQWAYADLVTDHEERTEQAFTMGERPSTFVQWLGEKFDLSPVS
jgi:hypothetical protein